jgi:hypothetical protein
MNRGVSSLASPGPSAESLSRSRAGDTGRCLPLGVPGAEPRHQTHQEGTTWIIAFPPCRPLP